MAWRFFLGIKICWVRKDIFSVAQNNRGFLRRSVFSQNEEVRTRRSKANVFIMSLCRLCCCRRRCCLRRRWSLTVFDASAVKDKLIKFALLRSQSFSKTNVFFCKCFKRSMNGKNNKRRMIPLLEKMFGEDHA